MTQGISTEKKAQRVESELKLLIKGACSFEYYQAGNLYYRTENGDLLFPVPVQDFGSSKLEAREKGIILMRFIKRQLNANKSDSDQLQ